MKMKMYGAAALAAVTLIALSACSGSGTPGASGSAAAKPKTACVMLPDAVSSGRWENGDHQALEAAFKDAGYKTNIQNAQGDTGKYATLAQQELTQGCNVMVLVDYNGAAIQVTTKAHAQGVPVIAYDRPIKGADYYVSFDNFHVGELQGQMIVDGLKAAGKDPATAKVIFVPGDPTDGNALQFKNGAVSIMSAAGIKPTFTTTGTWLPDKAQTYFEQAYTAVKGDVDAVWAANDGNAGAAIAVLNKNGKTAVVDGQDGQVANLQYILLGKQYGTVFKPFQLEATAASKLAIQLLKGEKPTFDKKDTTGVPFEALQPIVVHADNLQTVIDQGGAKYSDVCTAALAAACKKYNIHEKS